MATTPQQTGLKIDKAINDLNAKWDLQLPRLHGYQAREAETKGHLGLKCSSRIRYLCFKADDIESVLSDFDDRARQIYSRWVFKPSQEPGTLPLLPVTKSLVAREVQAKRATRVVYLTNSQRDELLQLLFNILDDNFQLARMTDSVSFERASVTSYSTAPTTPRKSTVSRRREEARTPTHKGSHISEAAPTEIDEPHLKDSIANSSKRILGSPNGRNKRRQTIRDEFQPEAAPALTEVNPPFPLDPTSFETVSSTRASTVFTSAEENNSGIASNDTSMISSLAEASQDLFPTQVLDDIMEDAEFRTSFNQACIATSRDNPTDLISNTPFKQQATLPSNVSFWVSWEVHRAASVLGLLPIDLHKQIEESCKSEKLSFEALWNLVKQRCREKPRQAMPLKSELQSWTTVDNLYEDAKSNRVVYLTGTLDWSDDLSKGLFTFRLNEIHLEQSCRLHRKFGADRFVVISAPVFSILPAKVRALDQDVVPLNDKIMDFLATKQHFIAGRWWRVCFVEPDKTKSRERKQHPPRLKIVLFAESGYDMGPQLSLRHLNISELKVGGRHPKIRLEDLTNWHMPIKDNLHSSNLKSFARWSIGFSKTTPTIELQPHEFQYLRDPEEGPIMNDGCALMSYPLARAIWTAYDGEGEPPSAVQGRIAGAKGLWIVDYENKYVGVSNRGYWIEVSDSQLKIKPHPRDCLDADRMQRTFEVLKYAGECREGHLNTQLISILEDRGVPREVLKDALESDTKSFSNSLWDAMKDPKALRLWMQEHSKASRSEAKRLLGSFPDGHREQMMLLLESGFHPRHCYKLIKNASKILGDYMTRYVERLWIRLPQSTVVFCAPDPRGVLAEREVYIGFSERKQHPKTDMLDDVLNNVDVLVARNPAYLASDMQKRRAVFKPELRQYKNVILFSTKGTTPLASLLSGGDYDGDTCSVIWDEEFVRHFEDVNPPQLPTEEECGMNQESKPLSDIFIEGRSEQEAMDDFLLGCVTFNARSTLMGMCSAEHEKLVYFLSLKQKTQPTKMSHQGTVKLAALAGYLVDSHKQGWSLSDKAWHDLRRAASGRFQLQEPAFKRGTTPQRRDGSCINVIDYLKFDVAMSQQEQILSTWEKLMKDTGTYDIVLSGYWKQVDEMADLEKLAKDMQLGPKGSVPTLADMLKGDDGLETQITLVKDLWAKLAAQNGVGSTPGEWNDLQKFSTIVHPVFERFKAIEPKNVDHELRRRFEEERAQNHPFPYWSLLKASCLHLKVCSKWSFPEWVWYVAGRELCQLKALAHANKGGEVRIVTGEMMDIVKIDSKYTRSLLAGTAVDVQEVDVTDEDVYVDADDGHQTVHLTDEEEEEEEVFYGWDD